MKTAEQLRNDIQAINIKLAQGVPDDKAHVLMMDKSELEEELKALEEALPDHEEVVVAVQTFDLEAIMEEDGTPLYALVEDETARGILKLKFQSVNGGLVKSHNLEVINLIKRHKAEIDGYQERETQLKRQNDELQLNYRTAEEHLELAHKQYHDLNTEFIKSQDDLRDANNRNAEIEVNRQNAASQLEEEQELHNITKAELERIKSGHKFTEDELKEQADKLTSAWKDRLIKVTNVRQKEELSTKILLAERADTLETIECESIYFKGRYEEVTAERALLIREEYERNHIVPPAIEEIAENTFPEKTDTASDLPEAQPSDEQEDTGDRPADAGQDESVDVVTETWEQSIERRISELEAWKNNGYQIAS